MIKEKYITPIAIISIMLCVFLILAYPIINPNTKKNTLEISQPEYIDKLFDKSQVNEIDITVNEKDWEGLLENAIEKEYIIGDININGEKFSSVGIRPKGNSSLKMVAGDNTTNRYSFKIDFHEYIKGQTYYGLEKLALNNCISDATYMKEYISYEMFSNMGIATPACSYAHIKINGEEWGLYLAIEVMEESFIERYFGSADGNLYKPESTKTGGNPGASSGTSLVYNGDDLSNYDGIFDNVVFSTTNRKDNEKVIEMIKNLNEGTNLERYLDVDEVLKYFAVNTFLVNLDSYAGNLKHNYYLYERNGMFQILPWDLNLSFAGYQVRDGQSAVNFPIDEPVSDTMENSPLISKLLEVEEYKKTYHEYLSMIVTDYIESGEYEETIDKVNKLINDYVKDDSTAFYTYEEYQNSISVLKQLGVDRGKSIEAQLKGQQPSTSYGTIETTVDLSVLGSMGRPRENISPGQKTFGNGNMPNREVMEQVIEIIRNTTGNELTEDERTKLVELGLNDNQIEEMLKMKDKMLPRNNNGAQNEDEFKLKENVPREEPKGEIKKDDTKKQMLIISFISILILLLALVFAYKFKSWLS